MKARSFSRVVFIVVSLFAQTLAAYSAEKLKSDHISNIVNKLGGQDWEYSCKSGSIEKNLEKMLLLHVLYLNMYFCHYFYHFYHPLYFYFHFCVTVAIADSIVI